MDQFADFPKWVPLHASQWMTAESPSRAVSHEWPSERLHMGRDGAVQVLVNDEAEEAAAARDIAPPAPEPKKED